MRRRTADATRARRVRVAVAWAGVVAMGGAAPAAAQEEDAFAWVRIGAGVADMKPGLPEGDYWRPSPGPKLLVETPLRPGVLSLGLERHTARAGADVLDTGPDQLGWSLIWLGWGGEIGPRRLRLGGEGRIGTLVSSAPDGFSNPVERELTLGGAAWLRVDLVAGLSLRTEVAAGRVYARHPWSPVSLSVALAQELRLPSGVSAALAEPPPVPTTDVSAAGPSAAGATVYARPAGGSAGAGPATAAVGDATAWRSFAELPSSALGVEGVATDRVDQSWSPGALRSPEAGALRLWLDGIPVRDATLGGSPWAWLPLGVDDIGSIVGIDHPTLVDGRPELEGALHVTTAPPKGGRTIRARGLMLNESRDPGPLRFTALTSPNVDGPLYEGDATAGHAWEDGWVAATVVRRERWSVTRPELRERNPAFLRGSSSRVRTDGVSVGLHERAAGATIRGRAWASDGDRYLRAPGVGTELSADVRNRGAGASASVPATSTDSLDLFVVGTSWDARSPNEVDPVAGAPTLSWAESSLDAGLRYRVLRSALGLTAGVEARRSTAGRPAHRAARTSGAVHMSVTRAFDPWRFEGGALAGGDADGLGGLLRLERAPAASARVGVSVSVHSGGRGGPLSLWDHAIEDPGLLEFLGVGYDALQERSSGTRTSLRIDAAVERAGWVASADLSLHAFRGERRPGIAYAWEGEVVRGRFGPLEAGAGEVLVGSVSVRTPGGAPVTGGFRVTATRPAGRGAFGAWWSGAPRVRAQADARVALRPGWALRGLLSSRTSVTWDGFDEVEARGAVPGGGRLPAGVDAELHLVGSLLAGRLRVSAGVANLLDADIRRHPLGAGEARGLVLGVATAW